MSKAINSWKHFITDRILQRIRLTSKATSKTLRTSLCFCLYIVSILLVKLGVSTDWPLSLMVIQLKNLIKNVITFTSFVCNLQYLFPCDFFNEKERCNPGEHSGLYLLSLLNYPRSSNLSFVSEQTEQRRFYTLEMLMVCSKLSLPSSSKIVYFILTTYCKCFSISR